MLYTAKMKYSILLLFLVGCSHSNKVIDAIDYPMPAVPPESPILFPSSEPLEFSPNAEELANIQINPLPHPFNVGGTLPYAIWVNGKRVPLNSNETRALAKSLNLKFEQPKNTAEIHRGEGWLYPLKLDKNMNRDESFFFEEEAFIDIDE